VCEEFGCVPSVAERELDEHYDRVLDVLWARAYARAKDAYDGSQRLPADERARVLADPLVQQVRDTAFALAAEALAQRREETGG
jgi:hypothetical protein